MVPGLALASTPMSKLDKEVESWKGFPWALRKEVQELWNTMIKKVRERFGDAIEQSGENFTTDPFFMALLLAQQRSIRLLQAEVEDTKRRMEPLGNQCD